MECHYREDRARLERPFELGVFSADGIRVVSCSKVESVRIWNVTMGEIERILECYLCAFSVSFSPDGRCVMSGSRDKSVRLWNATTGEIEGMLPGHSREVLSVTFLADETCVASGSCDG